MIENIEYIFPENKENIELFELLIKIFKGIPYATITANKEISFISERIKPKTIFKLNKDINDIQLNIGDSRYTELLVGNREYTNDLNGIKRVQIKEIAQKLVGHIKRIDHTGINLPTRTFSKEDWKRLLKYLASKANIYNYPTGEPWPFLIPTTENENKTEITNFEIIREPRLELVHDEYTNRPTLQIDFETDLSKTEVEQLFPKEKGIYFNNLEEVFKSIYLEYSGYIDIRFDIRFETTHDDFENGKWFVEEGKRIEK